MGEIECRRLHLIKLADIHLEIFVESVEIRILPKMMSYMAAHGTTTLVPVFTITLNRSQHHHYQELSKEHTHESPMSLSLIVVPIS